MATPICPDCGKPGRCFHDGDISGSSSYYDRYRFECQNPECGIKDEQVEYGGDSGWNNWHTICPYCGVGGDSPPLIPTPVIDTNSPAIQ